MRGATVGEGIESNLSGRVLGLAESGAVVRALEDLAVKVNGGLEPGRVIGTFPNRGVGREVEAAPLGQLLKLVLVHFCSVNSALSLPQESGSLGEMVAGARSDQLVSGQTVAIKV